MKKEQSANYKDSNPAQPFKNAGALAQAIEFAIQQGKKAAEELETGIRETLAALHESTRLLQHWKSDIPTSAKKEVLTSVAERYIELVESKRREMKEAFARQKKSLDTFNIVFFGRTGAGKSSLIEALSCGHGKSVSQGESDWTVEVGSVSWNSCVLIDTPGINGWGRSRPRAELEEKARLATESADIVMLCFDSQSQQESEFAKVGEWIHKYRKPAIAVLNARNQRWRMPPLVHEVSARKAVSQHIQENASNIRAELARIGLSSIPIIAISAKRALVSRAREPYEGPDAVTFRKYRSEYGCDNLFAWSNLQSIEDLLIEALSTDAAAIRTGMLRDKLRGTLDSLDLELDALASEAKKTCTIVENSIESVFKVVGYPSDDYRKAFENPRINGDSLTYLESLRGGPYQSLRKGEYAVHLEHILSSRFAPQQSEALNKADRIIAEAFDEGIEISGKAFNKRVLSYELMESTANEVLKDCAGFLERKIHLVGRDAKTDCHCLMGEGTSVSGRAGKSYKWASRISKTGGILAGAAATLGSLALANAWNPFGWAAGTAAAISGIGAFCAGLLGWAGRAAQRKSERIRLSARRCVLADAHKYVKHVFKGFREMVQEEATKYAQAGMKEVLLAPIIEGISLYLVLEQVKRLRLRNSKSVQKLTEQKNPMRVFERAATHIENCRLPGDDSAAGKIWLGESWLDDTKGLISPIGDSTAKRTRAYDPNILEAAIEQIRSAFSKITQKPIRGSGREWLEEFRNAAISDKELVIILAELEAVASTNLPRLHLHGDYNSGKTSFIKRLLIDSGVNLHESLTVRGNPTTTEISSFVWQGIQLIDTPGFQSGRAEDATTSSRVSPDASFVLYLLQPTFLTGDVHDMRTVLKGDSSTGFIGKLHRTFFIINRADDIGVDPYENHKGFIHLCESKRRELVKAIATHGMEASEDRIFCMASDPYQLVSGRMDVNSTHFDPFRSWDGFKPFSEAFRRIQSELIQVGCDISILEGGIARLSRLQIQAKESLHKISKQREFLIRIQHLLQDALSEGNMIVSDVEGKISNIVREYSFGLLDEVFGSVDQAELSALASHLSKWWEDKGFKDEVAQWHEESRRAINTWAERVQDELGRRFASPEFAAIFPEIKESFASETLCQEKSGWGKRLLDTVEKPLQLGGNRTVVYKVGKFMGKNFRPWGTFKYAARFAKASAALAAIGVALDIVDFVRSEKQEAKRESSRAKAREFVLKTSEQFTKELLDGEGGPIKYMHENDTEVKNQQGALCSELHGLDEELDLLKQRIAKYSRLMDSGRLHLGLPNMEAGHE